MSTHAQMRPVTQRHRAKRTDLSRQRIAVAPGKMPRVGEPTRMAGSLPCYELMVTVHRFLANRTHPDPTRVGWREIEVLATVRAVALHESEATR